MSWLYGTNPYNARQVLKKLLKQCTDQQLSDFVRKHGNCRWDLPIKKVVNRIPAWQVSVLVGEYRRIVEKNNKNKPKVEEKKCRRIRLKHPS